MVDAVSPTSTTTLDLGLSGALSLNHDRLGAGSPSTPMLTFAVPPTCACTLRKRSSSSNFGGSEAQYNDNDDDDDDDNDNEWMNESAVI